MVPDVDGEIGPGPDAARRLGDVIRDQRHAKLQLVRLFLRSIQKKKHPE